MSQGATNADVIYTDIWVSMGEPDSVWAERIRLLTPLSGQRQGHVHDRPGAIFMHCLPSFHDTRTTIGADIAKKFGITEMEVTDQVFESNSPWCSTRPRTGCTPSRPLSTPPCTEKGAPHGF